MYGSLPCPFLPAPAGRGRTSVAQSTRATYTSGLGGGAPWKKAATFS